MILELAGYVLLVIAAVVPIVNPFSTAFVFVAMTGHAEEADRRRIALMACVYMSVLLVAFLLLGALILEFFGISLPSLRIAGGLIVGYMGFRMLFPVAKETVPHAEGDDELRHAAFTPLALPMLAGPGSMSVVMGMAASVASQETLLDKVAGYIVVAVGIVISAAICWLVLRGAGTIVRFMGETGRVAVTKLMGFLLICIGTEFVLTGWSMTNS